MKCAGQTENDVGEAPMPGGCRSVRRGKGQLEPGGIEERTTALLLLWHSRGQGEPGDLLEFLWSQ